MTALSYIISPLFHFVFNKCEKFTFIQNLDRRNENDICDINIPMAMDEKMAG